MAKTQILPICSQTTDLNLDLIEATEVMPVFLYIVKHQHEN